LQGVNYMADQFVWLIGGSQMALPMAQEIKRRGYKLLLTDINAACVCRPLADRYAGVSVYSEAANLDFARQLDVRPVAVVTAGTDAGVEVSAIAEYFSLPAAPLAVSKRVRNKAMMRSVLDLPYPRYKAAVMYSQLAEWDIYPCVVKPGDNSGSKGFSVVRSRDELAAAFNRAQVANRTGHLVLVEEMLRPKNVMPELKDFDTAEISLDFLVENGQTVWANGALRLFHKNLPGIEAGHFNPYTPDDSIIQQVQKMAEKLGVTTGPLKVDFMQDDRYGWVLQEAATRLSGGFDSGFTSPLATGRDVYGAYLDLSLGQGLDPGKLEDKKGRVACCLAPVHRPGKIKGWQEPDEGIVFYNAQTEIRPLVSNSDRPVFVVADGQDHQEAYAAAKALAERVKPIYV
jgi:biotin carboxylase